MGNFSQCLGGHTFYESNSNVSDHCNPDCQGHLSNSLDIEHHVLLVNKNCSVLRNIHVLHTIGGSSVVQHNIVAYYPASLSASAAVVPPTAAVCFAPRLLHARLVMK